MKSVTSGVLFVVCLSTLCLGQSAPCGCSFTNVTPQPSCPADAGFHSGMSCSTATVKCPGTDDLSLAFGYENPSGTQNGTIVLLSGGGGTSPVGIGNEDAYAGFYLNTDGNGNGYQVVEWKWKTPWEITGDQTTKNIKTAACRPPRSCGGCTTIFTAIRTAEIVASVHRELAEALRRLLTL